MGMPAALVSRAVVVLPGLAARMKATHPSAPECDHRGVAALPGGPAPVCRVSLDLVPGVLAAWTAAIASAPRGQAP
jgi:hypothetical protein